MTRADQARENFLHGDTCAEAVLRAFAGEREEAEALLALARPFGGGMGRLRLTCGCVSGGVMAIGLFFPECKKSELYALVQEYARRFTERNGSVICLELLTGAHVEADRSPQAEARTAEYYRKRPCPQLVYDAAELLEALLAERGKL